MTTDEKILAVVQHKLQTLGEAHKALIKEYEMMQCVLAYRKTKVTDPRIKEVMRQYELAINLNVDTINSWDDSYFVDEEELAEDLKL